MWAAEGMRSADGAGSLARLPLGLTKMVVIVVEVCAAFGLTTS